MAVSIIKVFVFGCDIDGCDEWSDDFVPLAIERRQTAWSRRQAIAAGWTFGPCDMRLKKSDPYHFARCPKHSTAMKAAA